MPGYFQNVLRDAANLPQLFRIIAARDEFADAFDDARAVFAVVTPNHESFVRRTFTFARPAVTSSPTVAGM